MWILETIAIAFSMYSAIPMPQFSWNENNMRYVLCAFPFIGVVIGGLSFATAAVCDVLAMPVILRGAVLCLIPVLITGGIHLDGYADTCDALASHQAPEKKLEILKDPHVGSFAVIRVCCYMILMFALWTALPEYRPAEILLGYCLSRSLSGLAVASFPLSKNTGLAYTFAAAADKKKVKMSLLTKSGAIVLIMAVLSVEGAAMAAAALAVYGYYYRMAIREFGGLSGDLAGWFLQQCEKWMLIAFVVMEFMERAI